MHYPDSRWRPRCQRKSRDDVSGRIRSILLIVRVHNLPANDQCKFIKKMMGPFPLVANILL